MTKVINMNERGTLTLPKELRRRLGLPTGGQLVAEDTTEGVLLRTGVTFPVEIYTAQRIAEFQRHNEEALARRRPPEMRVFLDANILFSAAQPKSRLRPLLALIARQGECVTNAYAVEEPRRNLALKQPTLVPEFEKLVRAMELATGLVTDLPVKLPAKDVPILGGAIAGAATHLLTGDEQDFGAYFGKTLRGVKILTPRMLADELDRQGGR